MIMVLLLACCVGRVESEVSPRDLIVGGLVGAVAGVGGAFLVQNLLTPKVGQIPGEKEEKTEFKLNTEFKTKTEHDKKLSDFIGQELVVNQVRRFISSFQEFENHKELGAKKRRGLLIEGARGNGKTLLARAIAGEMKACLIEFSKDKDANEFKKLEDLDALFDFAKEKAKTETTIIFFDDLKNISGFDLEKLFEKIDEIEDSENLLLVATASLDGSPFDIDFQSMFEKSGIDKIKIYFPGLDGRKAILEHYLQKVKLDTELSVAKVAREWSGFFNQQQAITAESLKNFIERAAYLALVDRDIFVRDSHLKDALLEIAGGSKVDISRSEKEAKRTAVHEAGHVLAMILSGGKVYGTSIVPRERFDGVAISVEKHEFFGYKDEKEMKQIIIFCLGGYCAERLIYGYVGGGTSSDLFGASEVASSMVNFFGHGKGVEALTKFFLSSDKAMEKFDKAAIEIVENCRKITEKLLTENKDLLIKLADALFEKKVLFADEIYEIVGEPRDLTDLVSLDDCIAG